MSSDALFNRLRSSVSSFVQLHNSTDALVVLNDVTLQSSGRYRCEVSGEAPSFQTVSDHGDMVVVGGYTQSSHVINPLIYHEHFLHSSSSTGRGPKNNRRIAPVSNQRIGECQLHLGTLKTGNPSQLVYQRRGGARPRYAGALFTASDGPGGPGDVHARPTVSSATASLYERRHETEGNRTEVHSR